MTKTFKDIKAHYGYSPSKLGKYDTYALENRDQMQSLFRVLISRDELELLLSLFRESPKLTDVDHIIFTFPKACALPVGQFQTYLEGLDTTEIAQLMNSSWPLLVSYLINDLQAAEVLLSASTDKSQANAYLWDGINWAANNKKYALVKRLLEKLSELNLRASSEMNDILSDIFRRGDLNVIKICLEHYDCKQLHLFSIISANIPSAVSHIYKSVECDRLFAAAISSGHLDLVAFFMNSTIRANAGQLDNLFLITARFNKHFTILNRLLEIQSVRQSKLSHLEGWPRPKCYRNGLVRALWLELEKTPGFNQIKSLTELTEFARHYLAQHAGWVHESFCIKIDELVSSLSAQVLALRDQGYCDFVHIEEQEFKNSLYTKCFQQRWLDNINQFINLPNNLIQFEKQPQLRFLANRCFQHRTEKLGLEGPDIVSNSSKVIPKSHKH